MDDLAETWQIHGPAVLERLAKEKPAALLQAMVMLTPKDVNLHTTIGVSADAFAQNFHNALSLLHGERLPQAKTIEHVRQR